MTHRSSLAALLLLGSCVAAWAAPAPTPPPPPDFTKITVKTTDLGHGVYMLAGAGGNVTIAVAKDGVIMIDSQFGPMHDKLMSAIRSLTPLPIRYLINTHFHGDHTQGNEAFGKEGAVIVGAENLRKRLTQPQPAPGGGMAPPFPDAALPKITLADPVKGQVTSMTLYLDGETAQITHIPPAHTDTDSYIYFPEANVLASGDVFQEHYPFLNGPHGSDIDGIIAADDMLLKLVNDQTKIVPGHGVVSSKADLVAFRTAMATIRANVAALVAQGKSEDEVVAARPTAAFDAKFQADEAYAARFIRPLYQELKSR